MSLAFWNLQNITNNHDDDSTSEETFKLPQIFYTLWKMNNAFNLASMRSFKANAGVEYR